MSAVLDAWLGGQKAGWLVQDGEELTFGYEPAWRADPAAYPLSPPLGFDAAVDPSAWRRRCRRYLENLLQEGQALDDLLTGHAVSRTNVFALMRIVGRETAGALSLLPEGSAPDTTGTRREIPLSELSGRIRARDELPFSVWDGRVRLSIAGHQDKIGVQRDGDRLFLVDGAFASTHILKPESRRFPALVVNEAFCLRLAAASGISAADATILRVPEPVLCVRRFDRDGADTEVKRLHVIDGCQALDLPVGHKYERIFGSGRDVAHVRDGASVPLLHGLASRTPTPARTQQDLLRRRIFDFLVGNADAHAKNISFYVTPAGLVLAPAYDVVCVAAYAGLDQELALAIGDQFDPDAVGPRDWDQLADDCVVSRAFVARERRVMATKVGRALARVGDDLAETSGEREVLTTIRAVVERRIAAMEG